MTGVERAELQHAVNRLNDVLNRLCATYGDTVRVIPRANFDTLRGTASVSVEVTTSVERFE